MYYLILYYIYFYVYKNFPYDALNSNTINHYVVIRAEFFSWLVG